MKKYLIPLLSLVLLAGIALPVFAQGTTASDLLKQVGDQAQISGGKDLPSIIALIINVILTLVGVILLVLIVYAGFIWMTAQGDSKKVDEAKTTLKNAIIGLIITLAAYAISSFVIENIVNSAVGA